MLEKTSTEKSRSVDHYGASYGNFTSDVVARVRREAFGEDIGQNGWQTAAEQDMFLQWMKLGAHSRLLDFACGAGGPSLRIAEKSGCEVDGVDIDPRAISAASGFAQQQGLTGRVRFHTADGGQRIAFADETFDAIICIDGINHLPNRGALFDEWERVLKPGGIVLFTNPAVITGPITGEELRIRSSIGAFLFTPSGSDETMLEQCGFRLIQRDDRTANMAASARGRHDARARHADELRRLEGDETFERQQVFFATAAHLAEERRLSRIALMARRG